MAEELESIKPNPNLLAVCNILDGLEGDEGSQRDWPNDISGESYERPRQRRFDSWPK